MATVGVLYKQGTKFDLPYYEKTHMPLVLKSWSSYGMTSYKIVKFGDDAPYCIMALLEFKDSASFKAAGEGPEIKTVLGDIPNFSDTQPVIMPGEIAFTS